MMKVRTALAGVLPATILVSLLLTSVAGRKATPDHIKEHRYDPYGLAKLRVRNDGSWEVDESYLDKDLKLKNNLFLGFIPIPRTRFLTNLLTWVFMIISAGLLFTAAASGLFNISTSGSVPILVCGLLTGMYAFKLRANKRYFENKTFDAIAKSSIWFEGDNSDEVGFTLLMTTLFFILYVGLPIAGVILSGMEGAHLAQLLLAIFGGITMIVPVGWSIKYIICDYKRSNMTGSEAYYLDTMDSSELENIRSKYSNEVDEPIKKSHGNGTSRQETPMKKLWKSVSNESGPSLDSCRKIDHTQNLITPKPKYLKRSESYPELPELDN